MYNIPSIMYLHVVRWTSISSFFKTKFIDLKFDLLSQEEILSFSPTQIHEIFNEIKQN
jgi:hypothetical protein